MKPNKYLAFYLIFYWWFSMLCRVDNFYWKTGSLNVFIERVVVILICLVPKDGVASKFTRMIN